jgi:hypothetical protein
LFLLLDEALPPPQTCDDRLQQNLVVFQPYFLNL